MNRLPEFARAVLTTGFVWAAIGFGAGWMIFGPDPDARQNEDAARDVGYDEGYDEGYQDGFELRTDPCAYWTEELKDAERLQSLTKDPTPAPGKSATPSIISTLFDDKIEKAKNGIAKSCPQ